MVGTPSATAGTTLSDDASDHTPLDAATLDDTTPLAGAAAAAATLTDTAPDETATDETTDSEVAADDTTPLAAVAAAAATLTDTPPDETATDETATDETTDGEGAADDTTPLAGAAAAAATLTNTTVDDTPPPPAPKVEAGADVVPSPPGDVDQEDPTTDPSQRFVWLIPALIAAAAVVVVALFAFGFLDDNTEPASAPEAVAAPVPTTAAPTTTTQAPTTTAAPSTTTTSTTIPDLASIEPVGDAIPMASLTLKAGGIGPLVIGDAAPDAIGRLRASLGRPEEVGVAGPELGLCAGDEGRFVRWAGLTVVVTGTLADGVFAGYRFEEQAVPTMHLDLATPSGLRVGDPLSTLNEVYAAYQIDYVSDGGTELFRLADEEGLLLWGPVSSIEDSGSVDGIHSPNACSSQDR